MRNVEALNRPLSIGSAAGKARFDEDGLMYHDNGGYEDLKIDLTPSRQGANLLPAYDFVNKGLLFPQAATNQRAHASEEFSHSRKLGTPIHPHVHFIQTSATIPIFKMLFRWYSQGSTIPSFTEYTTVGFGVFPYTGTPILQITYFPEIPSILNGLSSHIDLELWREGDNLAENVLAKFVDFHYLENSIGSRTQSSKE